MRQCWRHKVLNALQLCVQEVANIFFMFYLFVHVAGKYFLSMNHDSSTFLFVKECIWNSILESIDKGDYWLINKNDWLINQTNMLFLDVKTDLHFHLRCHQSKILRCFISKQDEGLKENRIFYVFARRTSVSSLMQLVTVNSSA